MIGDPQNVGLAGQGAAIEPPEHVDLSAKNTNEIVVAAATKTRPLPHRDAVASRLKLQGAADQAAESSQLDSISIGCGSEYGFREASALAVVLIGRDGN